MSIKISLTSIGQLALLGWLACPVLWAATPGRESQPADPLDACNIVWDSPSRDSGGSMPLGNGDIGLNAWVEANGDLVFFIAKTDAWTDSGRLVKLGQKRMRLTPSLSAKPFRQELQLRQGQMVVRSGVDGSATTLRLWIDANRPVIHVEGQSQKDMQAQVGLYVWRTTDRDMRGDEMPELYAVFPYRLYAVGCPELDIGYRSVETYSPAQPRTVYPLEGRVGGWRLNPIQVAFVGKADQAARMVVSNFASHDPGSRFPAFWGPNQVGLPDQSHGGVSMTALQAMLLQVDGKKIYLFPAWPKNWDVNFKLHALYNTTVEGKLRSGKVTSLKVTPESRKADVINMLVK